MSEDLYQELRRSLDQYTVGYPAAPSGVEVAILKKLFTPEEAQMFIQMSFKSETAQAVALRLNQNPGHVAGLLEGMADKGLVFRKRQGNQYVYRIAPFVVGIYEYQMKRMDRDLAELLEQYHQETWLEEISRYPTGFRTIPLGEALDSSWTVAPYDLIREFLKTQDRICVATCVCRIQKKLVDKGCGHPLEACFYFGSHADYVVDKHGGRWVTLEEALEIQDLCEKSGLVTQVDGTENPVALCHCCDCCCGMLLALKRHSRPADSVVSNYCAEVDSDLCTGCELCLDRCPLQAIVLTEEGVAFVDGTRCIGCALCVPECPVDALTLRFKPEELRREAPLDKMEAALQMAKLRGRL